jgi:hypothetical protein
MPHFYRHSGIVPFGGLVQTLFAGVGAAISIGIVYSFAMVYTVTVDKKGNVKTKSKLLVEKLQVAAADVPLVKEAGAPPAAVAEMPAVETAAEVALPATENDAGASPVVE